jgi:hypothetical protein
MNYGVEIAGLMAEGHKLHVTAETHKKERGRDREYQHMQIQQSQIHDRQCELQRQAAQEFAALNGWRWTERQFLASTLVRGGTHDSNRWVHDELLDGWTSHHMFDHPVFFREIARPYRTAAIVGQPYDTKPNEARAIAAKIGLELHVPPNLTASWWYPGYARFFCFTRPEVMCVQFLPEQMEKLEDKS